MKTYYRITLPYFNIEKGIKDIVVEMYKDCKKYILNENLKIDKNIEPKSFPLHRMEKLEELSKRKQIKPYIRKEYFQSNEYAYFDNFGDMAIYYLELSKQYKLELENHIKETQNKINNLSDKEEFIKENYIEFLI